eukprot:TRINITY_DN36442_c0_g1_i1.p1 TRINITY_DN36442_c0_g1~~TRINITY_DN36442_c0_g1_i1.p1  ORF type:complete len:408 (-),score=107.26 TRINITY_DN36442_c0_g1_i1:225-1448(-)
MSNAVSWRAAAAAGAAACAIGGAKWFSPPAAAEQTLRWRRAGYAANQDSTYGGEHVEAAFKRRGFEGPVSGDDWDVLWQYRAQVNAVVDLPRQPGRLVNQCNYFKAAGQKCKLHEHIQRVQQHLEQQAQSQQKEPPSARRWIQTFGLHDPAQIQAWRAAAANKEDSYWIVKPSTAGASMGIDLVAAADVASYQVKQQWSVVQEFLTRPYLGFGGRKFHLRLYILVTRWSPGPGVMLYNDGLVLRSRHAYTVEKPNSERDIFSRVGEDVEPLSVHVLWDHLGPEATKKVRDDLVAMLADLYTAALRESFGDYHEIREQRGFDCFDLHGLDVILDEELRPLLLEINMSPNLWVEREGEEHLSLQTSIKTPLVEQIVHWAQLRLRYGPPKTVEEAAALERKALVNFTRVR